MLPVRAHARVDRGLQIGRIERDRHQQVHHQDERQADPQEAIVQEYRASLALEARPHEQARHEKHERHQIHILERAEDVEPEPSLAIDDGERVPSKWRNVEGKCRVGQRAQVGQDGVEGQHDQDDERAQVTECQTGSRHCAAAVYEGRVGVNGNPGEKAQTIEVVRWPSDRAGTAYGKCSCTNSKSILVVFRSNQAGPRVLHCRQLNSLVKLLFDRAGGCQPSDVAGGR